MLKTLNSKLELYHRVRIVQLIIAINKILVSKVTTKYMLYVIMKRALHEQSKPFHIRLLNRRFLENLPFVVSVWQNGNVVVDQRNRFGFW